MAWDFTEGNKLINLGEEISKQLNNQARAYILLASFSQIYTENQERKADVKGLQFLQKGSSCKVGARKSLVIEKIIIKSKPSTRTRKIEKVTWRHPKDQQDTIFCRLKDTKL